MNYPLKNILLIALVSTASCHADATTAVTPIINFRSQGQDLARQKVNTSGNEYRADMDRLYGDFSITAEYTRSFKNNDSTKKLFGCWYLQDCNTLKILGSTSPSFDTKSLSANWFELPTDYEGSVCFEPLIQSITTDFNLYWGMDEWIQGLFLRIHTPLTWTKWDLGAKFTTTTSGTIAPIPNGVTTTFLDNAEKYFCKKEVETSTGWTTLPLSCSRFCGCLCDDDTRTKTRLADIQIDLGWNFLLDEDYHFGLFTRVVAPTGNKIKGEWLFEPVVGNGHHWELGGGLTGSASLWRNKEENKQLSFYLDAEITHLFSTHQRRVFDLKDKPLSRYIQAVKNYGTAQETWAPLANLTSCKMNVDVAVQSDITALLNYTCYNWSCDFGYNFWIRSCENFDCKTCDNSYCKDNCDSCKNCCGECIIKNGNRENWLIANDATINVVDYVATITLTNSMIDYDNARTKGISHKVFTHINYTWTEKDVVPFLGLGGFAEIGVNNTCCKSSAPATSIALGIVSNNNCCNDNCSGCKYVSLSQWGLWLKGGILF